MPVSRKLPHAVDGVLAGRLPFGMHGAVQLPTVEVLSHSLELKQRGRFIGDDASRPGFRRCLDEARRIARKAGRDPFGKKPSEDISNRRLELVLDGDDPHAIAVVTGAIDRFAAGLVRVITRYRQTATWKKVERIVVGGGFSGHRVGQLAMGRTQVLLHEAGLKIGICTIANDPDDAGLIGGVHLVPGWIFDGHDAILAVDIGGTNMRCGIVRLRQDKAADFGRADVVSSLIWRHADDDPKRTEAVAGLVAMLEKLVKRARNRKLKLAPFIAIGCPGRVRFDGLIDRGAQNLPGHWESEHFNLPMRVREALPTIRGHDTVVLMHNDAVVQGLSELPRMQGVRQWAVLTIGTGLGNAVFRNR